MKILLLGEYSGLHTNLKKGLKALGHEVILVSSGDGFKKIYGDININSNIKNKYLKAVAIRIKYFFIIIKSRNYDVIQFIDIYALPYSNFLRKLCLKYFKRSNKKIIFNSCSSETYLIAFMLGNFKYSPYSNELKEGKFDGAFKLLSYKKLLSAIILSKMYGGIISTSYSYKEAYSNFPNYTGFVPMPIILPEKNTLNLVKNKIQIFHGITRKEAKGSNYIIEALKRVQSNYKSFVDITIVEKIPFEEYKVLFDNCNIFIDQACSYGYGMNALMALAKGKVVLSGCEEGVEELLAAKCPVVNITPDASDIYNKIVYFIENKDIIEQVGKESYFFAKKHHDHIKIAEKYIELWGKVDN